MKANELRIGNYLMFNDELGNELVEAIFKSHSYITGKESWHIATENLEGEELNLFQPIQLTEKWLFDFDIFLNEMGRAWDCGCFIIVREDNIFWAEINSESIELPYVHTLQNLYFVLSENELKKTKDD